MSGKTEPTTIEEAHYYVIQRRWSTKGETGWTDASSKYWGEDGLPAALTIQADMAKTFGVGEVKMIRRDTLTTEVEVTTDVHTEHCCAKHGCKYGGEFKCTVENGLRRQSFLCETCDFELYEDGGWELAHLLNEMYDRGFQRVRTCMACKEETGDRCYRCA